MNWKAFLAGWLRNQPAVAAEVGARVYSKLPATKTYPLIVVQRIAGGSVDGHANSLHDPLFQIDCFAATEADASAAISAVESVLVPLWGRMTESGVTVTVSKAEVGTVHEGWDETNPTVARHRLSARLWLRP